ncbi:replication protein A 32 kDa subunit [Carcharodon carcharias]|uniref:replication protein A 32 kDa subunit n=1 Tax=Carcharodon carcharias TaxID=13397 RepID=UPI001B7EA330|nr:replication protein A 32 kDa subunit [Carcharodon carcharias]
MWNNPGSFDGNYGSFGDTGAGGGGYLQSPGGFGSPAGGSQSDRKTRSRAQQIVPCTVSQLMSATQVEEIFRIGEVELSQVTVVGVIKDAEKAPTNILYKLDDMTAPPMDVRQWVDTDEAGSENIVVPPGSYVKVAGHLRSFQNKKSLVAFKIMALEDMNELTSHMLEVVQAHLLLNKPQPAPGGSLALHTPTRNESAMGMYAGGNDALMNGLTSQQSQVLNLIRNCREQEGMSIDYMRRTLKNMTIVAIKQAVEFLSNEGHIYSTVDEDHFRSTDAE